MASDTIAAATYDEDHGVLRLEFRDGSAYDFFMVPLVTYEELLAADSPGKFFSQQIRPKHRSKSVG